MTESLVKNVENTTGDIVLNNIIELGNVNTNNNSKDFSNIINSLNAKTQKTQTNFVNKAVKSNTSSINKKVFDSNNADKTINKYNKNSESNSTESAQNTKESTVASDIKPQKTSKDSDSSNIDTKEIKVANKVNTNTKDDTETIETKDSNTNLNIDSWVEPSPVFLDSQEENTEILDVVAEAIGIEVTPNQTEELKISEIADKILSADVSQEQAENVIEIISSNNDLSQEQKDSLINVFEKNLLANNKTNESNNEQNFSKEVNVTDKTEDVSSDIELNVLSTDKTAASDEKTKLKDEIKTILGNNSKEDNDLTIKKDNTLSEKENFEVKDINPEDKETVSNNDKTVNIDSFNEDSINKTELNTISYKDTLQEKKQSTDDLSKQVDTQPENNKIENTDKIDVSKDKNTASLDTSDNSKEKQSYIETLNNEENFKNSVSENAKNNDSTANGNIETIKDSKNEINNAVDINEKTSTVAAVDNENNETEQSKDKADKEDTKSTDKIVIEDNEKTEILNDANQIKNNEKFELNENTLAQQVDYLKNDNDTEIQNNEIKQEDSNIQSPENTNQLSQDSNQDLKDFSKNDNTDYKEDKFDLDTKNKINFSDLNKTNTEEKPKVATQGDEVNIQEVEENLEKAAYTQEILDDMMISLEKVTSNSALTVADEVTKLALEENGSINSSNMQGQIVYDSIGNSFTFKNVTFAKGQESIFSQIQQKIESSEILNQINEKLSDLKNSVTQKLTMVLRPNDLGRLSIALSTNKDGLTTNIIAQNEDVRQYIEKNIDNLRKQLISAGINVNNIQIKTAGQEGSTNYDGNNGQTQNELYNQNQNGQSSPKGNNNQQNKNQNKEILAQMSNYDFSFSKDFSSVLNKTISYGLN